MSVGFYRLCVTWTLLCATSATSDPSLPLVSGSVVDSSTGGATFTTAFTGDPLGQLDPLTSGMRGGASFVTCAFGLMLRR